MTDPKDNLPETNEDIPTKEPTPEPGIETPDEGVPSEGEEETIYINVEDEIPPEDPTDEVIEETLDRRS